MRARVWWVFVAAALVGCGTADLRPDAWTSAPKPAEQERGKALLEELAQAHGGVDAWRAGGHTQFVVRDHWPHFITRAAAAPWPESGQRIRFTVRTGEDSSRAEFLEGSGQGEAWGIQQWVTYKVAKGGSPRFEPDSDVWFWLPTVEYFFEAPFRLREGQNVTYLGSETLGDRTFEKVFVTWGGWSLTDEIDQYVVWIDADTRRLGYLQYTVRDFGSSMQGTVAYSGYVDVGGGLLAPGDVRTVDAPGSTEVSLHRMQFTDVDYAAPVPPSFVVPDPSKKAGKGDEGEAR